MMELVREWLLGVTGAAFVLALADGLMPEGTAKRMGRLTGGLLLFLAMLRPIAAFDFDGLARQLAQYDWAQAGPSSTLEAENQKVTADIIAEELEAYIEEKAADMGARCTAEVTCREEAPFLQVPDTVRITGTFPDGVQEALCRMIAEELDIPAQRQSYVQEEAS